MSTINPQQRWYRSPRFLPALRAILWGLSGAIAVLVGFVLAVVAWQDGAWALGIAPVALIIAIGAGLTDSNTADADRQAHYIWPFVAWMFGLWACGAGAGLLLGASWSTLRDETTGSAPWLWALGSALVVAGALLLIGATVLRRRKRARAARARGIRLTGARVPAVVTEVTRNRGDNTVPRWNVTLKFTDSQGVERWHKLVHHAQVFVGSRHWIRFDPKAPGRRSTLFVEWNQR